MRLLIIVLSLFSYANAQQAAPQGQGIISFIMIIGFVLFMYFFMMRPQQKRAKEMRTLLESLKKGDEVVTNSGIVGRISALGDNFLSLEIANNVEVKIQKQAVISLMPKGSYKGEL